MMHYIHVVLLLPSILIAGEGEKAQALTEEAVAQNQRAVDDVINALNDSRLWENAGPRDPVKGKLVPKPREAELLKYLELVEKLHAEAAAPILISHIAFDLESSSPLVRSIPDYAKYPAYKALRSLGLPAVSAIINHLKSFDADKFKLPEKTFNSEQERVVYYDKLFDQAQQHDARQRDYRLLQNCMIEIYTEGNHRLLREGMQHVILRIQQELKEMKYKGEGESREAKQLEVHLDRMKTRLKALPEE